jgi:hypothetical protein
MGYLKKRMRPFIFTSSRPIRQTKGPWVKEQPMSVSIDFDLDLDFVRIWAIPGKDTQPRWGKKRMTAMARAPLASPNNGFTFSRAVDNIFKCFQTIPFVSSQTAKRHRRSDRWHHTAACFSMIFR